MVSASANARECSNTDMPTSVMDGICCNEHDKLSTIWDRLSRKNEGQRSENDPDRARISGLGLLMPTAAQASASVDWNSSVEVSVWSEPPSVDQSNRLYLLLSP